MCKVTLSKFLKLRSIWNCSSIIGLKKERQDYSDDSIKNTVLRPNRQYKASTAEMAEYRYS